MNEVDPAGQAAPILAPPAPRDDRRIWLREGLRVLAFREPRWERLNGTPLAVVLLLLSSFVYAAGFQRLLIDGDARFYWISALNGWAGTGALLLACWIATRSSRRGASAVPSVATLFALSIAASLIVFIGTSLLFLALRQALGSQDQWPTGLHWAIFLTQILWAALASMRLLWHEAGAPLVRVGAMLLIAANFAVISWLQPVNFWWPTRGETTAEESEEAADYGLKVTEDVLVAQPRLIADALAALPASTPGKVNVYAATFAPYGTQDVFMHESAVVAKTMAERFDAGGRTVELVMNPATGTMLPWATRDNLHRTIDRIAAVMDRDKDVLFLHLTSHGGKDAKLAADAWPLKTEPLTPDVLKQWLDEAGIRWRVISVSACYSGSWIPPLAGDGTLVMTAADAEHTSYGCGSRSPLTFFGQAMYVDALKTTWSFTQAHEEARKLIDVREKAAGKKDGYSNPQISEGSAIRELLQRLEAQQRRR